jgi:transcriptional regulator with XRE-family HTH domain
MTPDDTTQVLAAIFRAERARQQITQANLAKLAGMPQPTLSRKLSGKADITIEEASHLAEALKLDFTQVIAEAYDASHSTMRPARREELGLVAHTPDHETEQEETERNHP